jgi:hypothetical protein
LLSVYYDTPFRHRVALAIGEFTKKNKNEEEIYECLANLILPTTIGLSSMQKG